MSKLQNLYSIIYYLYSIIYTLYSIKVASQLLMRFQPILSHTNSRFHRDT